MRQFTTPEQTAKLIELGFEKPRIAAGVTKWDGYEPICTGCYTIGELIEMLPPTITSIKGRDNFLLIEHFYNEFRVRYGGRPDLLLITDEELVDALYNTIVKLKEVGVI